MLCSEVHLHGLCDIFKLPSGLNFVEFFFSEIVPDWRRNGMKAWAFSNKQKRENQDLPVLVEIFSNQEP